MKAESQPESKPDGRLRKAKLADSDFHIKT
jgi:hypothetical protein